MAPESDLRPLADLAREAALAAGAVIRGAGRGVTPEEKATHDYVTSVDRAAEGAIRGVLGRGSPAIPVLGEEGGGPDAAPELWVVDPLDGTANFVHGFPAVGVSIALARGGRPVVGVVHAPFLGETYLAVSGGGATVERADGTEPLRVSDRPLARAIVTTGLPFRRRDALPRFLETFERVFGAIEDIRRPGAASLDLAWVASGVFEGYFELGLAPWDVAAGGLLVEEAGGRVTDWSGGDGWVAGEILAGNLAVHAALLDLV